MNLSEDKQPPTGRNAGAVPVWGPAHAAPAHPMTVGAVGFGPAWTMEDSMAASIVRLEQEAEELRAEVALLREERAILQRKFAGVIEGGTNAAVPSPSGEHGRPSDLSPRTNLTEVRGVPIEELRATNAVAEQERAILVREMERLREQIADYRNTIESLRDQLCADKCRDKAAADGGWANI